MTSAIISRDVRRCPACQCRSAHRCTRRGLVDRVLSTVQIKPFRCAVCKTRFHARQYNLEQTAEQNQAQTKS